MFFGVFFCVSISPNLRSARCVLSSLFRHHFLVLSALAANPTASEVENQTAGQGTIEGERKHAGKEAGFAGGDQDGYIEPSDDDDHC